MTSAVIFTGFELWKQAATTGADLLWRAKNNVTPRRIAELADGSWLGEMRLSNTRTPRRHPGDHRGDLIADLPVIAWDLRSMMTEARSPSWHTRHDASTAMT